MCQLQTELTVHALRSLSKACLAFSPLTPCPASAMASGALLRSGCGNALESLAHGPAPASA
eukprot:4658416-Alexandrium_andersonii.AAC.1